MWVSFTPHLNMQKLIIYLIFYLSCFIFRPPMPTNAPTKFDVEHIMKDQIMSKLFSHDTNILVPVGRLIENETPLIESSMQEGEQGASLSDLPSINKPGLLKYYAETKDKLFTSANSTLSTYGEKPEDVLIPAIRWTISCILSETNAVRTSVRGSLMIRTEGQRPITLKFTDSDGNSSTITKTVSVTPSKRKAYLPVKYTALASSSDCSSSSSSFAMNPLQLSGFTTPSPSGSCAIDLSKGNSTAPSSEITPIKQRAAHPLQRVLFNPVALLQQSGNPGSWQEQQCKFGSVSTITSQTHRSPNEVNPVHAKRKRTNSITSRFFPCNQCQGVYNSLRDLEQHTISKHETYRCMYCNASFTQRSNLQRHSLKHVGFKPFECGICDKSYFRKDHLMRHMETSHPEVPARENIRVLLTSSESLDYLSRFMKVEITETVVERGCSFDGSTSREDDLSLFKNDLVLVESDGAEFVKPVDIRRPSESLPVESRPHASSVV